MLKAVKNAHVYYHHHRHRRRHRHYYHLMIIILLLHEYLTPMKYRRTTCLHTHYLVTGRGAAGVVLCTFPYVYYILCIT